MANIIRAELENKNLGPTPKPRKRKIHDTTSSVSKTVNKLPLIGRELKQQRTDNVQLYSIPPSGNTSKNYETNIPIDNCTRYETTLSRENQNCDVMQPFSKNIKDGSHHVDNNNIIGSNQLNNSTKRGGGGGTINNNINATSHNMADPFSSQLQPNGDGSDKENVQSSITKTTENKFSRRSTSSSSRRQSRQALLITSCDRPNLIAWQCSYCTYQNHDWNKRFCEACEKRRSTTVQPIAVESLTDTEDSKNDNVMVSDSMKRNENYENERPKAPAPITVCHMNEVGIIDPPFNDNQIRTKKIVQSDTILMATVNVDSNSNDTKNVNASTGNHTFMQKLLATRKQRGEKSKMAKTNIIKSTKNGKDRKSNTKDYRESRCRVDESENKKKSLTITGFNNEQFPINKQLEFNSKSASTFPSLIPNGIIGFEKNEAGEDAKGSIVTFTNPCPAGSEQSMIKQLSNQVTELVALFKQQDEYNRQQYQKLARSQNNFFTQVLNCLNFNEGKKVVTNQTISTVEVSPSSDDSESKPILQQYQVETPGSFCKPPVCRDEVTNEETQTQDPDGSLTAFLPIQSKNQLTSTNSMTNITSPKIQKTDWHDTNNHTSQLLFTPLDGRSKSDICPTNDSLSSNTGAQFKIHDRHLHTEKESTNQTAFTSHGLPDADILMVQDDIPKQDEFELEKERRLSSATKPTPSLVQMYDDSRCTTTTGAEENICKQVSSAVKKSRKTNSSYLNAKSRDGIDQSDCLASKSASKPSSWISNKPSREFILELEEVSRKRFSPVFPSTDFKKVENSSNVECDVHKVEIAMSEVAKPTNSNHLVYVSDNMEPAYPYKDTVRCKTTREGLPCHDCKSCRSFFEVLQKTGHDVSNHHGLNDVEPQATAIEQIEKHNKNRDRFSRHRALYAPNHTPPDFWELDFVDEIPGRQNS